MNQLSIPERTRIIACLIEGCSLRSTVRMTGFAKKTVSRVLVETGQAWAEYHDKVMRNLPCKVMQVDEIWSFTYCKQANIPERFKGDDGLGDTWTWVAIDSPTKLVPSWTWVALDAETKLVASWYVGDRTLASAQLFIQDLAGRLAHRIQLTSDGHKPYIQAVEDAFGAEIDYAMLIKIFKAPTDNESRYSPPKCIGIRKRAINGQPVSGLVSTSFVERQNLTIRMTNRRFTRLTNAFSKKLENHKHALALQFVNYNFARIHQTLRVTPAMEAGIAKHVWKLEEIASLKTTKPTEINI